MTGRHAASGRENDRGRSGMGGRARDRVVDAATVVAGAGAALTGAELDGWAGAGLVVAGVGAPALWLAVGSARLRHKLTTEQAARKRAAAMAGAQDARIHALRMRLRELDQAQTASRDELRTASTGLMATRVELAHMRSELDAARGELMAARDQMFDMREQLTAMLSHRVLEDFDPIPQIVIPGAATASASQLILPPEVIRASRAEHFPAGDRVAFEAFAESDLDDLTGIISVSDVLEHAREQAAADRAADTAADVTAEMTADMAVDMALDQAIDDLVVSTVAESVDVADEAPATGTDGPTATPAKAPRSTRSRAKRSRTPQPSTDANGVTDETIEIPVVTVDAALQAALEASGASPVLQQPQPAAVEPQPAKPQPAAPVEVAAADSEAA